MVYSYGITQQGTYHIKKGLVCQDAHKTIKCGDRVAISAVADGLGSEQHSDVAAQIAVAKSTEYCANLLHDDCSDEQILQVMKEAFSVAQAAIEREAEKNGHEYDQYDTTLSLAIMKNGSLFFGHSGDSGIVALTADGRFEKVTEQQRDEEGRVFPLFFGESKWVFGKYSKPVASVFLATDGVFETLFPVYIREEPVSIYVPLARYFMDPDALHIEEVGEDAVQDRIGNYICNIPDSKVNDDKTVVVMVDTESTIERQPPEYYAEPDWPVLIAKYREKVNRMLYPDLYSEEKPQDSVVTNDKEDTEETQKVNRSDESMITDSIEKSQSETPLEKASDTGESNGACLLKKLFGNKEKANQ